MSTTYTYTDQVSGIHFHHGDTTTESYYHRSQPVYLPLLSVYLNAKILSTTTRTTLTQTFHNPSKNRPIDNARYTFPLYANCCVVSFVCHIGDTKVITGVIQTKEAAKATFDKAVENGQTAGLLGQETTEIFSTQLGNIPPGVTIKVEIEYITELKHDSEADGIRFTVPTAIAPRYGTPPVALGNDSISLSGTGIKLSVEVTMAENIRSVESTSHPISVLLGTHKDSVENQSGGGKGGYNPKKALATLFQSDSVFSEDFVLIVTTITPHFLSKEQALLETHPTIPDQKALMVTLVPRFNMPKSSKKSDVIFLVDCSGSMQDKIEPMKSALRIFMKSLPVGCRFNIVSFGNSYSFLWPQPQDYTRETLEWAERNIESFSANMGGTEMLPPIMEIFNRREQPGQVENNTEVMILTDGEIWGLDSLLSFVAMARQQSKGRLRVFSLGIGRGVSHALVEGVARAGGGYSEILAPGEEHSKEGVLEGKVVRMLNSALSDHIGDYRLEVVYEEDGDISTDDSDGGEITPPSSTGTRRKRTLQVRKSPPQKSPDLLPKKKSRVIKLFDKAVAPLRMSPKPQEKLKRGKFSGASSGNDSRFSHLKDITGPEVLQAPFNIPTLFPFERSVVYLLLPPSKDLMVPKLVTLKATSSDGDKLMMDIPVTRLENPDTTIHQLGARMALRDLEEGRSWIHSGNYGVAINETPEKIAEYVEREGEKFAVKWALVSKWTSFVAVEEEILFEKSDIPEEVAKVANSPKERDNGPDDSMTDSDIDGDTNMDTPTVSTPTSAVHSLMVLPKVPVSLPPQHLKARGAISNPGRRITRMNVVSHESTGSSMVRMLKPPLGTQPMTPNSWDLVTDAVGSVSMDTSKNSGLSSNPHRSYFHPTGESPKVYSSYASSLLSPSRGSQGFSGLQSMSPLIPQALPSSPPPRRPVDGKKTLLQKLRQEREKKRSIRISPIAEMSNSSISPATMGNSSISPASPSVENDILASRISPAFFMAAERINSSASSLEDDIYHFAYYPQSPLKSGENKVEGEISAPPHTPLPVPAATQLHSYLQGINGPLEEKKWTKRGDDLQEEDDEIPYNHEVVPPTTIYTPREKLEKLIRIQLFDGSYPYTMELARIMGLSDVAAATEFMAASDSHTTALVAVYLSHILGQFRNIWLLIVGKAWAFVEASGNRTELEKRATELIATGAGGN